MNWNLTFDYHGTHKRIKIRHKQLEYFIHSVRTKNKADCNMNFDRNKTNIVARFRSVGEHKNELR